VPMVVAFIGFIFVVVGAYVAWVVWSSIPH
jgi:hypothetical protein